MAVAAGAYAVIYEGDFEIFDFEVAFLRADNLNLALWRLARYFMTERGHSAALASPVQIAILRHLFLPKNAVILEREPDHAFMQIFRASEEGACFFSDDFSSLQKLSFEPVALGVRGVSNLNESSLFFCDLDMGGARYANLQFPPFFADELCGVCEFFASRGLDFRVRDLRDFPHFRAIFVNRFSRPVAFGTSERAFICESDPALFEREAAYLRGKNAKVKICAPKSLNLNFADVQFANPAELAKLNGFTYALALCDWNELFGSLSQERVEPSLFGDF